MVRLVSLQPVLLAQVPVAVRGADRVWSGVVVAGVVVAGVVLGVGTGSSSLQPDCKPWGFACARTCW